MTKALTSDDSEMAVHIQRAFDAKTEYRCEQWVSENICESSALMNGTRLVSDQWEILAPLFFEMLKLKGSECGLDFMNPRATAWVKIHNQVHYLSQSWDKEQVEHLLWKWMLGVDDKTAKDGSKWSLSNLCDQLPNEHSSNISRVYDLGPCGLRVKMSFSKKDASVSLYIRKIGFTQLDRFAAFLESIELQKVSNNPISKSPTAPPHRL